MSGRLVEFNSLPGEVRARFVRSSWGGAEPEPIVSLPVRKRQRFQAGNVALVAGGAALLGAYLIFKGGITGYGTGVVAALCGAVALGALAYIIRSKVQHNQYPYREGHYLYARDYVETDGRKLRIIPTEDIEDASILPITDRWGGVQATLLQLTFRGGHSTVFLEGDEASSQRVLIELEAQRARAEEAARNYDHATLDAMDLFHDLRGQEKWDEQRSGDRGSGPLARSTPIYANMILAAVLGAAAGGAAWFFDRNAEDDKLWESSQEDGSSYAYGEYLERGGFRHVDEAHVEIPKAILREHKSQGSVTSLRAYLRDYPDHPDELREDARKTIHEHFNRALAKFKGTASTDDPNLVPFMERLLAYLEQKEVSVVSVKFGRPSTDMLTELDSYIALQGSKLSDRPIAPIAQHFSESQSTARHNAIVENLHAGFGQVFPGDILELREGGELEDADAPSMNINYIVGWAGNFYRNDKGVRDFVGIEVRFAVDLSIPGDKEPLRVDLNVVPPNEFTVQYNTSFMPALDLEGGSQDDLVYGTMALRAFDNLATGLSAAFFKPSLSKDVVPTLAPVGEDSLSGTYKIKKGVDERRKRYNGTVEITKLSRRVYKLEWKSRGRPVMGVGIWNPPHLVVGWGIGSYGVVVYDRAGDDIKGAWTVEDKLGQLGYEGGNKVEKGEGILGTYEIVGANPGRADEYKGVLSFAGTPGKFPYKVSWAFDDNTQEGLGFDNGQQFVAAYGQVFYGVTSYEVRDDGTLMGTSYALNQKRAGSELLVKQAAKADKPGK